MAGMPSHNWIDILPGSVSRKAMAYDQVDYRVITKTQVDSFTVRSNIVMCKKKSIELHPGPFPAADLHRSF
jgi:hypothetical protein